MFLPSNITLQFGDSGDFVAELQRRLAQMDCFGHDQINGFYDGSTVNGVSAFQSRSGLRADGIAGPDTLRRLNGAISGDTTGGAPESKPPEEPTPAPAANALEAFWKNEPAPGADTGTLDAPRRDAALEPVAVALAMASAELAPRAPEAPRPLPAPAPEVDLLAQMLLDHPPIPAAVAQATESPAARPPLDARPASPAIPVEMHPAAAIPVAPDAAVPLAPTAATPPAAPAPGLLQKTKQFASEMLQKLSNYFEAKLPPSVLQEVQAVGQAMVRNGVKEVAIPGGPENVRTQELPGRTTEPVPALPQRK